MLIAEKVSLDSQAQGGSFSSFSLKIYAVDTDLYKQIKLAQTSEFKLKTVQK